MLYAVSVELDTRNDDTNTEERLMNENLDALCLNDDDLDEVRQILDAVDECHSVRMEYCDEIQKSDTLWVMLCQTFGFWGDSRHDDTRRIYAHLVNTRQIDDHPCN
jgi:hypothetical protein